MSDIINAVIIDDEENFITSLEILINKNFPNINIIGKATNINDSVALLKLTNPKLVFLDINLPDGTAFDILEQLDQKDFEIIFTTASSEYAFRAFEFSAIHYLLKPMTVDKLKEAMDRYFKVQNANVSDDNLSVLKDSLFNNKTQKILLSSIEGMSLYNISDIIRCESDNNYTKIFFVKKDKILVSKPLLSFNKLLKNFDFVRIHNQHLINLRYVKKYLTGRKSSVLLLDGTELPVSQSHKNEFLDRLKLYANTF